MSTDPKVVEEVEVKTQLAPPWNVIVHNDPITLMSYVVMVFQKLFGYAYPTAHRMMMEVHNQGRSVVWTGALENAETYVQKLHSHQLLASMERVDS